MNNNYAGMFEATPKYKSRVGTRSSEKASELVHVKVKKLGL